VRERFAFPDAIIPDTLQSCANPSEEAVILSTCNRVEVYAATEIKENEARVLCCGDF
jgi:glutamyl-tRNA reductase